MPYMPYTMNPHLPRIRRDAVRLVKYEQWSIRKAARHFGVEPSTVMRWCQHPLAVWDIEIPTKSSRPHRHPHALSVEVISQILALRGERHECAEILHHRLTGVGLSVGLSSVKRVLRRYGLSRFSRWKKWHQYPPRPQAEKPGILVEIDSMHDGPTTDRLSLYALIDVCSRWGHAEVVERVNGLASFRFVVKARQSAPFSFRTIQTDHGSEYAKWFTKQLTSGGLEHRHSRVRTPTDNAHVERFIQTLQQQCLNRVTRTFQSWQRELPQFLHYYNTERPHMALNYQTPLQVLRSY
jgi:transposase InsO family protein